MPAESDLASLQQRLRYTFRDNARFIEALTHPSYIQQFPDSGAHYERLEFLGDAVLDNALAERLFILMPREREGVLSQNRSALARASQLAEIAGEIGLAAYIRMSDAEEENGGRDRVSTQGDSLEAVIGSIFLDGGWEAARNTVLHLYGDIAARLEKTRDANNPKGRLQEMVQPLLGNNAISYEVAEEEGPDHDKSFTVDLHIAGNPLARGEGRSKKEAAEAAALEALENWDVLAEKLAPDPDATRSDTASAEEK